MRRIWVVAAALASAALVVATLAPATFLAGAVGSWSAGRVELEDASGTVWSGAADVLLASGAAGQGTAGPGAEVQGGATLHTRVPGRTAWRISPWRLLTGTLDLSLSNPAALDAPLEMRVDRKAGADVDAGRLHLPAALLVGLGAPWNTIRPGGEIVLEWGALHLQPGAVRGQIRAEWLDASSGLSPVAPFGHYRLQASGLFEGATLQLETISGPMEMVGSGTIGSGLRLQFRGSARVQPGTDPAVATQLSGLISLLGVRDGDGAILNFGT